MVAALTGVLSVEEPKPRGDEVGVERKCCRHISPAHDEEAEVIDQTDVPLSRSLQLADAGGVQILIYPLDDEDRRVSCELDGCCEAETRLKERDGLDEHVIVSEQRFTILQNCLQAPNRGAMVWVGGVRPGVDRRGVQEDHFAKIAASASSCFSEIGDSPACFDRPARTDENWLMRIGR